MATVEFDVLDLVGFLGRLAGMRAALTVSLAEANQLFEDQIRGTLETLYTPRLAQLWEVETAAAGEPPELAKVRVWTDDKRVRGYEFGTRPHQIAAMNVRSLSFPWRGAQAFYVHVQHPGTRPHDRRDELRTEVAATASVVWSDALREILLF